MGHSYLRLLYETLTWHFCKRLLLDTLVGHSYLTLLSARHSYLRLVGHSGITHRHLLCKRQNNCGASAHSHRHLLCKRQYLRRRKSTWLTFETAPNEFAHGIALRCPRKRCCGRKRNFWRTQLCPQTPKMKREPSLRIREQTYGEKKMLGSKFGGNWPTITYLSTFGWFDADGSHDEQLRQQSRRNFGCLEG